VAASMTRACREKMRSYRITKKKYYSYHSTDGHDDMVMNELEFFEN
jgi:hypothetical protein